MPRRSDQGSRTKYPGIRRLKDGYLVRVKISDPQTKKPRQRERLLLGIDLDAALAARLEMIEELRTESSQGTPTQRTRLADFAAFWIRSKKPTINIYTARTYVTVLDLHIIPTLGDFTVDTIRAADVQALVTAWSEMPKTSKNTVRGWWRVLRMVLRDAVAMLHLERDPTMRIRIPDAPESEPGANTVTAQQLGRFLASLRRHNPSDHAIVTAMAFTGLRFCHVAGWKWEDIDEKRGVVHIRRRIYATKEGPISKKKRAPRETALDPALMNILKAHRERLLRAQAKGLEAGWVFPSRNGKARQLSSLVHSWVPATKDAGITARFTPHGLRRTFHDLARQSNAAPVVVKALVGHVTDAQHEHYSSVGMDEKRVAVANVVRLVRPGKSADQGADPASGNASQRRKGRR